MLTPRGQTHSPTPLGLLRRGANPESPELSREGSEAEGTASEGGKVCPPAACPGLGAGLSGESSIPGTSRRDILPQPSRSSQAPSGARCGEGAGVGGEGGREGGSLARS